jgi:hypothetical protein
MDFEVVGTLNFILVKKISYFGKEAIVSDIRCFWFFSTRLCNWQFLVNRIKDQAVFINLGISSFMKENAC